MCKTETFYLQSEKKRSREKGRGSVPKFTPIHKRCKADGSREMSVPLASWPPPFVSIALNRHGVRCPRQSASGSVD